MEHAPMEHAPTEHAPGDQPPLQGDRPGGAPEEAALRAWSETLVRAVYQALLLREADPGGLEAWTANLAEGRMDPLGLLRAMLGSEEFADRAGEVLRRHVAPDRLRFTNDTSQHGEIPLLLREIVNAASAHRIVVDVGARGRERSNSWDLLRHFGWRGLLVEANPALLPSIEAEFAGLDVQVLNRAVSDYAGEASFFIGANDDVSSLDRATATNWGDLRGQVTVRVDRLPSILAEHSIPRDFDLLSIDAEGEDVRILNDTIAAGFLPRWVLIEASDDFRVGSLADLSLLPVVAERYRLVGQTRSNLVLRSRFR